MLTLRPRVFSSPLSQEILGPTLKYKRTLAIRFEPVFDEMNSMNEISKQIPLQRMRITQVRWRLNGHERSSSHAVVDRPISEIYKFHLRIAATFPSETGNSYDSLFCMVTHTCMINLT